jgi:hypothetical protein
MRLGVVSDTHGYLDPEVIRLLQGVQLILHAGDIGDVAVVRRLEELAPLVAVRGNNDRAGPTSAYPWERTIDLPGTRLLLIHQVKLPAGPGDPGLAAYRHRGIGVVVSGHSHTSRQEWHDGVLFFNPGAAGKPRFRAIPSVGILTVDGGEVSGTILPLGRGQQSGLSLSSPPGSKASDISPPGGRRQRRPAGSSTRTWTPSTPR